MQPETINALLRVVGTITFATTAYPATIKFLRLFEHGEGLDPQAKLITLGIVTALLSSWMLYWCCDMDNDYDDRRGGNWIRVSANDDYFNPGTDIARILDAIGTLRSPIVPTN